jgi:glycosyltransferase involved in cell wall biosynthesis
LKSSSAVPEIEVTLLTGGSDKPYVLGLTAELLSAGVGIEVIGSDELECRELQNKPGLNFLNLRGDLGIDASFIRKVFRILRYYFKLMLYASTARPKIFHILWNNKFETFDRTLLMLYYKLLGKSVVLTAHNVNADSRDLKDTSLNRFTLRVQYRLADNIFVHTEKAKRELLEAFGVRESRITVIPFGINKTVPDTQLTPSEAKARLGLHNGEKTMLFFGRITPYKGIDYLVQALRSLEPREDYRVIIAGRPDDCESYWNELRKSLQVDVQSGQILLKAEFIPDDETEVYFKAADVFVLPYRQVYQSGVLFLGYSFGLPVLAADVGSLKDDIIEGQTGFAFKPEDPPDLKKAIERYFASDLYTDLTAKRREIREFAEQHHSWQVVGRSTIGIYAGLLKLPAVGNLSHRESKPFLDLNAPHSAIRSGASDGEPAKKNSHSLLP